MFFDGFFDFFGFYGRVVVVDFFVEVICFIDVLFRVDFVIDEIDVVVCVVRSVVKYFVGVICDGVFKIVCVGVVFV